MTVYMNNLYQVQNEIKFELHANRIIMYMLVIQCTIVPKITIYSFMAFFNDAVCTTCVTGGFVNSIYVLSVLFYGAVKY
jgi:hypothetical protein